MFAQKKIIFLFVLLVIFIAVCVNSHLPDIMENQNKQNTIKVIDNEQKNQEIQKIDSIPNKVVTPSIVIEENIPLIKTDLRYTRLDDEKRIEELSKLAQEIQLEINEYLKKNPITFEKKGYNITSSGEKAIEVLIAILNEEKNLIVEVAGHTDASGTLEYNQMVSLNRAKAVKQRLIILGIEEYRIKARGYGETIPIVENNANGYASANRRVEFNIIKE